jgi:hypothetical protein
LEYRAYGKVQQFRAVDEAIRTAQFIRSKCIRLWMDYHWVGRHDLSAYSAVLAKEFPRFKTTSRPVEYKTSGWKLTRIGNGSHSPTGTASTS